MADFITSIQNIKYEILKEVAELSFSNNLDKGLDEIPYKIISNNEARFRCCVYKEREIARERARLACGLLPLGSKGSRDNGQIVYVIDEACEGCPIARFQVTENCQGCITKRCKESCPFGAIIFTGKRAYIDQEKCRECGRCKGACPYNAIADLMRPCKRSCPVGAISMDDEKKAVIDETKCINCGVCTQECPFGAMGDISYIADVAEELRDNRPIYAMFAPAIEGQFGNNISVGMIKSALLELGFKGVYEVGLGADMVANEEAKEVMEIVENGGFATTSCCPAFVSMIQKHYPKLVDNISSTLSPMVVTARYIKQNQPKGRVVFIGPCMAKKNEMLSDSVVEYVDYVLTFEEMMALLDAKSVKFDTEEGERQSSVYGLGFAQSGGVSKAVLQIVDENDWDNKIIPKSCNGAVECKKALTIANAGRLTENLLEGMVCEGGCIGGPATITQVNNARRNLNRKLKDNDISSISDNLKKLDLLS